MQALRTTPSIRKRTGQIAGSAGSAQGQTDGRSLERTADGFLSHRFLPLYAPENSLPEQHEVEMGYFSSLSILSKATGMEPMDVTGLTYPYNILISHWDMRRKLNRQPIETGLHIIRDENERVRLATKQEFEPGHTLYYIPVMPLLQLFRNRERKACAELLLSVMAYLYHEVRIPYYRDESTYLFYQYECNKEWLMECAGDYDLEEYEENMSDIWKNEYCGDEMERKIYNRYNLEHLHERVNRFQPKDGIERDALRVASEAVELWRDFRGQTVFRYVAEIHPDNEDEIAPFEPYVSFVGECGGWLYDNVERGVSDWLNEFGDSVVPRRVQVFDDPEAGRATGLEFEYRLFELILNLSTLLQDLP